MSKPIDETDQVADGFHDAATSFRFDAPSIGQYLLASGLLDADTLENALQRQSRSGLRIGEELIGRGEIRPFDFYRSLATQAARPFVNLRLSPPDTSLLQAEDIDFYLQEQCLPWRRKNGTLAFVAVDIAKSSEGLREKIDEPFLLYQTSPLDILWAVQSAFSAHLTITARNSLIDRDRSASAHRLLSTRQRAALTVALLAVAISAYAFPLAAVYSLNAVTAFAFIALAALRLLSINIAHGRDSEKPILQTARPDKELPIYTIIIPLLREASVLPILVDALQKLDYPPSKLDIKLVLEETDFETIEAARRLELPGSFELVLVPPSHPTTKPKACNYALRFARGDLLVVYDAEDIPGPGQLREAVEVFDRGGPSLACAQAPLAYYNWKENWLTKHFAIEYASIFDLLLPTLARFGAPFPLGGTSTHFRTSVLREIGAWDPFNVTEDADLGFRLRETGYRTDVLSTPTLEEANCQLPSWVRQRSRWLKGWMQTYLVRMRQPRKSIEKLGLRGFLTFQIVIGAFILSALAHPFFYVAIAYALSSERELFGDPGTLLVLFFNISVLLLGFSATMLAGFAGAHARSLNGLGAHVLSMPLYWLLISFSAYRALFQLISRPHVWEKTDHGLSSMAPVYLARAQRKPAKPILLD